jgi:glycosyltransferase involved in cell wall biosynthesis
MQNVLFFIFRLHGGGAERTVSNLSLALSERYNIKIAIYDAEETTYPYKGELIRIKLLFSANPTKNPWYARLIRLVQLAFKLRALKRKYDIHIVVSFAEQANIINILTKGKERAILSMRTTLSKEMESASKMRVISWLVRILYNRAERIIVPSILSAKDLVTHFHVKEKKIDIIYNYIDSERVSQLAASPLTDEFERSLFQQDILLMVGRITPAKGMWLMFHVLKKLGPVYPDLKLVIIGDGESEASFKLQLIKYAINLGLKVYDDGKNGSENGLDHDLFFLGFESNPFHLMSKSLALVFPSAFEGFPNTLLEAMQSRLAVIAADCHSGPREILAPDTDPEKQTREMELAEYGILTPSLPSPNIEMPVDDRIISEWVKAVKLILSNERLREQYRQRGLERTKSFDRDEILGQWESLLDPQ